MCLSTEPDFLNDSQFTDRVLLLVAIYLIMLLSFIFYSLGCDRTDSLIPILISDINSWNTITCYRANLLSIHPSRRLSVLPSVRLSIHVKVSSVPRRVQGGFKEALRGKEADNVVKTRPEDGSHYCWRSSGGSTVGAKVPWRL